MSIGLAPDFQLLRSESNRALLVALRSAVTPILANNLLPHFTDHSVAHSDRLITLVDQLAAPLQSGPKRLTNKELTVTYAACYLHDIGMQYEDAGGTLVVRELGLTVPWDQLREDDRRELLRKHHPRISAEMVQLSVKVNPPILNLALPSELEPDIVAALCAAHTLDTESAEYTELMEGPPSIRVSLASALLRLADILDESQARAQRERARTLRLDIEAQTHWWRNYYTEDVTVDNNARVICVSFAFPPERKQEYSGIVPALQMPWIEDELVRHETILYGNGLGWSLKRSIRSTRYSTREIMPDDVLSAMVAQLSMRQTHVAERQRQIALQQFREAQPLFQRRLEAAEQKRVGNDEAGWVRDLAGIAGDMWALGAKQSAWTTLQGPFSRKSQLLEPAERLQIGSRLAMMILDDGPARLARDTLLRLTETAKSLPDNDLSKAEYYSALFSSHIANLEIPAAREALTHLNSFPLPVGVDLDELKTQLEEAELLTGSFAFPEGPVE